MSTAAPPGTRISLGPYDPALSQAMRLEAEVLPAEPGLLGYAARISQANVSLGYNYTGVEERVRRYPVEWSRALQLVESLCARCSQANTLAYVQAVESMAGLLVPPRAAYLRMVLAETERVNSHLLSIAETLDALGLADWGVTFRDLRERLIAGVAEWTGARVQPGLITYGGLTRNIDEADTRAVMLGTRHAERALRNQVTAILNSRPVSARLVKLGVIKPEEAELGGLRGPVARACGLAIDVRTSFPTGAYEEEGVTVIVQRGGDAFSRLVVRLLECLESLRLVETALDDLPPGPVKARGGLELRGGSGVGRAEGPRGEVFCWVSGGADGLGGLHVSAGSWPSIGVLPGLLKGANMEDLRLLLLSLDLCLACAER